MHIHKILHVFCRTHKIYLKSRSGEATYSLLYNKRQKIENPLFFKFISTLWDMHVFIRILMLLLQIHSNNQQIMKLQAAYEIHNQFDHSLNATNANLSRKWNEVPKWSGMTVSQLIYV